MRKRLIVMVAAALCAAVCALTACAKLGELEFDGLPDSYEGMDVAKGESAFALLREASANFAEESDYRRVQFYDFSTTSGVVSQSMQIKTTRKVKGEKLYSEEVVLATGMLRLNEGKKTYFDGDAAYSLYFNDKERVPGDGTDTFAVKEWDDFGAYDAERYGNIDEAKDNLKRLTAYRLDDKSCLAAANDDTVYLNGDTYYFTVTVDCSDAAMQGVQKSVAETIAKKTSGKPEDLKMLADTKIYAAVKKIDGKPKFTYLRIDEKFRGKLAIVNADCKSSYFNEFYYGEGETSGDELRGVGV